MEFKVIKLDQKRNNVVVSRRSVLEQENSEEREALLTSLQEGLQVKNSDARTEQAGAFASKIAKMPLVRRALLDLQRSFRERPGLIADGRDMGSVVFPDALLKVFLTASPSCRAERRHKQLKDKGIDVSLVALETSLVDRDYHDSSRRASPLKFLEDSMVIDSTDLDIGQVSYMIEKKMGDLLGEW